MFNINEIKDLIIKVFNYYNGRINIINKAVLNINLANQAGSNAGGFSHAPNIVTINPMVIIRFYSDDYKACMACVIETIIHELYHTDQIINYNLYNADANYTQSIEYACQLQTVIYMAGHQHEIYDIFGVDIFMDKNMYNKCISYFAIPGIYYQRRKYEDHIFMCIDNLVGMYKEMASGIYDLIKTAIINKNNFLLTINGDDIFIIDEGSLISIDDFNSKMQKYSCNGPYSPNMEVYITDDHDLIITINIDVKNIMCKNV